MQLYAGAVINGKPASSTHVRFSVPSVGGFERQLEQAQADLNIAPKDYVPVVFKRSDPDLAM